MPEIRRRLAELLAYMDETRVHLLETTAQMSPSLAMVRPRTDTWTPAENLAHLAMVEDGVSRLIAGAVEWARANGIPEDSSDESVMGSIDHFRMTEAVTKLIAPDRVTPQSDVPIEQSLASLQASRIRLREALIGGQDMDLTAVTRSHSRLGELNLYQWALFVAQHEERHRRQIERTLHEAAEVAAASAPIM